MIIPAGAVRLSEGLVPIPRTQVTSGTCIKVTESCRDMVAARTLDWLFDQADHEPTVCAAEGGQQWVTVREVGQVCWVAPVCDSPDEAGRDHRLRLPAPADNSNSGGGGGWVGARGGIRPARRSMLTPGTPHNTHVGGMLRDLFSGFFLPSR